jgi:hypothetical protein
LRPDAGSCGAASRSRYDRTSGQRDSKCQGYARSPRLEVGEALKKAGIAGSTIAGGHGTTAKQAEILDALGMEVSSR